MNHADKCLKCSSKRIELMKLQPAVALNFGTYYLGDRVTPALYICLDCGYCETWIDSSKELEDIRKYVEKRKQNKN